MADPMCREIGSEFWSIPLQSTPHTVFPAQMRWYLSGRVALQNILEDICRKHKVRTAALPSWCCDSMILPFLRCGLDVTFYTVCHDGHGGLIQAYPANTDVVLAMDYFGYAKGAASLAHNAIVIHDVTHTIPSLAESAELFNKADYTFGSLRKWAGFYTGGFAFAHDGFAVPKYDGKADGYTRMRECAMTQKRAYVEGRSDSKDYLALFGQAEDFLESPLAYAADDRDVMWAQRLDLAGLSRARRANAQVLLEALSEFAVFPTLDTQDVPLFVPVLVPDGKRDALRRHLIAQAIYCPCHWPSSSYHGDTDSPLYRDELSLVCDQRYTEADMLRICKEVQCFLKE